MREHGPTFPGGGKTLMDVQHSEQMPEAQRELTICRAAFSSLDSSVTELLNRLSSYIRDTEPPAMPSGLSEAGMPVCSEYGRELRAHSEGIGQLERKVSEVLKRLEL